MEDVIRRLDIASKCIKVENPNKKPIPCPECPYWRMFGDCTALFAEDVEELLRYLKMKGIEVK